MVSYVLQEDLILRYAFGALFFVLSDRADLNSTDWQGSGSLAEGSYDGLFVIVDFTWTPQLDFSLKKGSTLYVAFGSNGVVQLLFDYPA